LLRRNGPKTGDVTIEMKTGKIAKVVPTVASRVANAIDAHGIFVSMPHCEPYLACATEKHLNRVELVERNRSWPAAPAVIRKTLDAAAPIHSFPSFPFLAVGSG
jgi:hypothetical protein